MLQTLNILENVDLKSMGYNSASYIHTLYQAMNLAFADRDFYYGDPYVPPDEPIKGLLSKDYAKRAIRRRSTRSERPALRAGDPYPFQGEQEPVQRSAGEVAAVAPGPPTRRTAATAPMRRSGVSTRGTTSVQAADEEGWVVSITPSGGWVPAFIAGSTGFGM